MTVTNCIFQNNKAVQNGGAIDYNGFDKLTVNKCTFNNNDGNYGGAIHHIGTGLTVNKCTFKNNKATDKKYYGQGGAISTSIASATTVNPSLAMNTNSLKNLYKKSSVNITNSKFEKNTAKIGGAISVESSYYVDASYSKFTVTGSTFTSNKATDKKYGKGGAIYMYKSTATINNSKFTKNIAVKKYNAIYKDKSSKLTQKNIKITPKDSNKLK